MDRNSQIRPKSRKFWVLHKMQWMQRCYPLSWTMRISLRTRLQYSFTTVLCDLANLLWNLIKWFYLKSIFRDAKTISPKWSCYPLIMVRASLPIFIQNGENLNKVVANNLFLRNGWWLIIHDIIIMTSLWQHRDAWF